MSRHSWGSRCHPPWIYRKRQSQCYHASYWQSFPPIQPIFILAPFPLRNATMTTVCLQIVPDSNLKLSIVEDKFCWPKSCFNLSKLVNMIVKHFESRHPNQGRFVQHTPPPVPCANNDHLSRWNSGTPPIIKPFPFIYNWTKYSEQWASLYFLNLRTIALTTGIPPTLSSKYSKAAAVISSHLMQ